MPKKETILSLQSRVSSSPGLSLRGSEPSLQLYEPEGVWITGWWGGWSGCESVGARASSPGSCAPQGTCLLLNLPAQYRTAVPILHPLSALLPRLPCSDLSLHADPVLVCVCVMPPILPHLSPLWSPSMVLCYSHSRSFPQWQIMKAYLLPSYPQIPLVSCYSYFLMSGALPDHGWLTVPGAV